MILKNTCGLWSILLFRLKALFLYYSKKLYTFSSIIIVSNKHRKKYLLLKYHTPTFTWLSISFRIAHISHQGKVVEDHSSHQSLCKCYHSTSSEGMNLRDYSSKLSHHIACNTEGIDEFFGKDQVFSGNHDHLCHLPS